MPNFLLLLIVFFTLSWGIRYGILAAVLGGLLKDGFSVGTFGLYTIIFVIVAYLTTVLSKYIYRKGSEPLRLLLVSVILLINIILHCILRVISGGVEIMPMIQYVFFPELLMTLLTATWTFQYLRICVLKLSV